MSKDGALCASSVRHASEEEREREKWDCRSSAVCCRGDIKKEHRISSKQPNPTLSSFGVLFFILSSRHDRGTIVVQLLYTHLGFIHSQVTFV